MKKRILVAYASRSGSTAETADMIAHELSLQKGITAEAASVKNAKDIASYDAIILGTAIHMGRPLPEMLSFVKSYQPILATKKVASFGMCMSLIKETPQTLKESDAYLATLNAQCKPFESRVFAGNVNLSKLKFMSRMIVKMVKSPVGDFRKLDDIKMWARETGKKLIVSE